MPVPGTWIKVLVMRLTAIGDDTGRRPPEILDVSNKRNLQAVECVSALKNRIIPDVTKQDLPVTDRRINSTAKASKHVSVKKPLHLNGFMGIGKVIEALMQ